MKHQGPPNLVSSNSSFFGSPIPGGPAFFYPAPLRGHIWKKPEREEEGKKTQSGKGAKSQGTPLQDCHREVSDNDEISSSDPPSALRLCGFAALRFLPLRNPLFSNLRGSFLGAMCHPVGLEFSRQLNPKSPKLGIITPCLSVQV